MFIAAVSAAAQTHNISFPQRQKLEAIFARTKFHLDAAFFANLQCSSIKWERQESCVITPDLFHSDPHWQTIPWCTWILPNNFSRSWAEELNCKINGTVYFFFLKICLIYLRLSETKKLRNNRAEWNWNGIWRTGHLHLGFRRKSL